MKPIIIHVIENNAQKNYFQMTMISFLRSDQAQYAVFQFPNEILAKQFHRYMSMSLAINLVEGEKMRVLLQDHEALSDKDKVVIKGNIFQVIDFLIAEEAISEKTRFTLQDKDEAKIQAFLEESKTASLPTSQSTKICFNENDVLKHVLFPKIKKQGGVANPALFRNQEIQISTKSS